LSWKPVRGAQAYEVEVTGARTLSLKVPKAEAQLPALPKGTYRWSVRAWSEEGKPSEPSATRTFEVVEAPLQLEVKPSSWK
ncbi:MAG: peptidoglycan-binding protein LysM, partial [Myxococcota bacterium]